MRSQMGAALAFGTRWRIEFWGCVVRADETKAD